MKLKPGSVIKILVESSYTKRGHYKGYWLVTDIHDAPFVKMNPMPKSYGVVRCTKTGKPFKYNNGFGTEWIDRLIDEGKAAIVR